MDRTTRAIVAFAVGPLVLAGVFAGYLALDGPPNSRAPQDLIADTLGIAALFTYPAALVIGVPAYLLAIRFHTLGCQHVFVVSAAAGAVVGMLLGSLPLGVLICVSAGATFCLIWHRA